MIEYLIQGDTLTNLADKIRVLSGTEGTMLPSEMTSNVQTANDEVDVQSDLIDKLIAALNGKAAGNGSGSGDPYIVNVSANCQAAVIVGVEDAIFEYEVVTVDGASYGFALNDNGYYESQNKGVGGSKAMCKIMFHSNHKRTIKLSCINYAESNYDFGIISQLDTMLSLTEWNDTTGYLRNFKGSSSETAVDVSVEIPAGDHFICAKFTKDGSGDQNNDSLQFKVVI